MAYQSVNPFNGELLRAFEEHTDQQMEKMLATAEKTFREVSSKKAIRERSQVIGRAGRGEASGSQRILHAADYPHRHHSGESC